MKDTRVSLDGKAMTNESEYIVFSAFIPKENREEQVRYFPFSGEWGIDLTTVRDDAPLPSSCGYYSGRSFKIRKYVFCENKGENFELIFTDSKRKFDSFANERLIQENKFLDDLRKKAKERLDKIKGQR